MSTNQGFFKKLKQLWHAFYQDYQTPYRLIKIEQKGTQKLAVIGLRFSHMIFKTRVEQAIFDDSLLAGLSPQDIRNLAMYAVFCSMQDKFELVNVEYADNEKIYFNIKDKQSSDEHRIASDELMKCPEIINQFKRSELYKMGYLCGKKNKQNH